MLNFLVESFGLLNDLFPLPEILDAGYPLFDLHLADVLFDVILPSVLGVFLGIFWLEVSNLQILIYCIWWWCTAFCMIPSGWPVIGTLKV